MRVWCWYFKFWSHIINLVNNANIINLENTQKTKIIYSENQSQQILQQPIKLHKILTLDETERIKETHLTLGLEQVDLKLRKKKWLDPNLITCVVLKMRRIGVNRNPIWNLQMKREKWLRSEGARILEVMKQTQVLVLLLGKTRRELRASFIFLRKKNNFYLLSFWITIFSNHKKKSSIVMKKNFTYKCIILITHLNFFMIKKCSNSILHGRLIFIIHIKTWSTFGTGTSNTIPSLL